jgi:phage-related protein
MTKTGDPSKRKYRRHWRDYRTPAGGRPVKDFFDSLTDHEAAEVLAAMKEVAEVGLESARHLRGEVYEVRAETETQGFRVLFATEGRFGQVLLSLTAFSKKTRKVPQQELELAESRLRSWRDRGGARKKN